MQLLILLIVFITIYIIYFINSKPELKQGDQGFQGIQGERGIKGDKGDKGDQGIIGPKGEKGEKGDKGDKGDQGIPGTTSAKGDTGARGDMGPKGDTGPRGERGEKGDRGIKGDKGDTGDIGPKGEKGDQGERGEAGDGKYDKAWDFILGSADNKTRGDSGRSRALVKVEGGKLVINYDDDYQGVTINSNKSPLRLMGKVEVSDILTSKSFSTNGDNISISHKNPYIDFRDETGKRNIYMMGNKGKLYVDGIVEVKDGIKGIDQWNLEQYDYKNFNSNTHKNAGGYWRFCPPGKYMCGVHKDGGNGDINNMQCCSFAR